MPPETTAFLCDYSEWPLKVTLTLFLSPGLKPEPRYYRPQHPSLPWHRMHLGWTVLELLRSTSEPTRPVKEETEPTCVSQGFATGGCGTAPPPRMSKKVTKFQQKFILK